MIIWIIKWLFFQLEFAIQNDLSLRSLELNLDILPTLSITITPQDGDGYKYHSITAAWLIFSITFSYYYPDLLVFDEEGTVVGKHMYPSFMVKDLREY